ncbi:MAG: hypothetical protein AB9869_12990 [Verrucomicrobiia bacterium]
MNTPEPNDRELTLRLEALTGPGWRTDPVLRLRAALKRLLRDYGMKCTDCRPVGDEQATANGQNR